MITLSLSYLLDILVLALAAWASPMRGWRLFLALFALSWLIGSFNLVIEAVAFAVMTPQQALLGAAASAALFALMSLLVTVGATALKRNDAGIVPARFTALRLAGVIVAYLVLYITAGVLILPYVRKFYPDSSLPTLDLVITLQVFRALVFAAGSALLLRGGVRYAPWILGLAFSVLGGIAPLLPDNPFMPLGMRMPHMLEVGVSNFLFGFVTAILLRSKRAQRSVGVHPATAI